MNNPTPTPEGGWLGLMVEIGRQSKSDEEYDAKLADALKEFPEDHPVSELLWQYDWKSAKRAAFCAVPYRKMFERDVLKGNTNV